MDGEIEEYVDDISSHCQAPEIDQLFRIWTIASRSVDGGLPGMSALNLQTLAPYRENLMLLDQVGPKSFMFLYEGRQFLQYVGFNMTGKTTDELPKDMPNVTVKRYIRCIQERRPLYFRHPGTVTSVDTWERLVLPLERGDGHPMLLVYCVPTKLRPTSPDAVVEASLDGILTVQPIADDTGRIQDAKIVSANQRIRKLGDLGKETRLVGRRMSEVMPHMVAEWQWREIQTVLDSGEARALDAPVTSVDDMYAFRIGVVPFDDGAMITFTDVSDIMEAADSVRRKHADLVHEHETLRQQAADLAALAEELQLSREELAREIERRKSAEQRLKEIADTDPLTGICNRRAFIERGEALIETAAANDMPVAVIVSDIDHFKQVNDTYGHATGDAAITMVAKALAGLAGPDDIVGRFGGEEFAVILADRTLAAAHALAETMRNHISGLKITHKDISLSLTASFGVSLLSGGEDTMDAVIARADAALYEAKSAGRNCVVVDWIADMAENTGTYG